MQNLSKNVCWLGATVGRKQMIGLTGLGLCGFVLMHMLGNLLILIGPQVYNQYSHALVSNPLIYLAEAGLLGMFFVHLFFALLMTRLNLKARDSRYAVRANGEKGTSLIARTLWVQGVLIFVFLCLHLLSFKFGTYYEVKYGDVVMRDIHRLVVELFHEPIYVFGYVVALIILGFHLSHGVSSSLQSLGFHHPRYTPKVKKLGWAFAGLVTIGFVVQPLYVYFIYRG